MWILKMREVRFKSKVQDIYVVIVLELGLYFIQLMFLWIRHNEVLINYAI